MSTRRPTSTSLHEATLTSISAMAKGFLKYQNFASQYTGRVEADGTHGRQTPGGRWWWIVVEESSRGCRAQSRLPANFGMSTHSSLSRQSSVTFPFPCGLGLGLGTGLGNNYSPFRRWFFLSFRFFSLL